MWNLEVTCGLVSSNRLIQSQNNKVLVLAESFVGKGKVIKGLRRHARCRTGIVEYFHCHYFVRLEEGSPPEIYYAHTPKQPHEQLQEWLAQMRKRKIINSL